MSASGEGPHYHACFESLRDPEERYPLDEIVYTDRSGGLLRVAHDMEQLKRTPAEQWKRIFEERAHRTEWPYGSGVWGKKEWVLPEVDNENVVSMYEGHSNLFWAERYGRKLGLEDLWIKLCGNSHTGSFKDLGMTVLISAVKELIARGKEIPAVACASTGDTSAALAAYAAAAGIPAIVFLPHGKVSTAQLIQPVANGAITLQLETDFDGCMAIVRQVAARDGIYLANSMNSLRIEGQKTVGMEIVQQFDWDVPLEFYEVGLIDKLPRLACAQAERANPLYRSYLTDFEKFEPVRAAATLASAIQIGNPVSYEKAVRMLKRFDGIVDQASEEELVEAVAEADRTGLFNCPHTGVALAVLKKLLARGEIRSDEKVVVISTAHGLKFTDFKVHYHRDELPGISSALPNEPIVLPASYDRVRDEIFRQIETRFGSA
jgi:threonine synthase